MKSSKLYDEATGAFLAAYTSVDSAFRSGKRRARKNGKPVLVVDFESGGRWRISARYDFFPQAIVHPIDFFREKS